MAVVARVEILRMRPAVHVDRAERVRPADIENVDAFGLGDIDEFNAVWRDEFARPARRFAPRMRLVTLEVGLTRGVQRPRPGLEGHVLELDVVRQMTYRVRAVDALRVQGQLHDAWRRPDAFFAGRRTEI